MHFLAVLATGVLNLTLVVSPNDARLNEVPIEIEVPGEIWEQYGEVVRALVAEILHVR